MRFDGKLKDWNDDRGYGFIEPTLGGQEIFVHIKAFPPGTGRPKVGLPLSFEVELGPQGRKRAKAVQFVRPAPARPRRHAETPAPWTLPRMLVIPLFVLVYLYVATTWSVRPFVALVYAGASLLAFVAYVLDKMAAKEGRWRISESTLHAFSLIGGWPGALVAQQVLRHKTSKTSFQTAYWATVAANVAGFVGIHWVRFSGLVA